MTDSDVTELDDETFRQRLEYINSLESPEYSMDELNDYFSKQKKYPLNLKTQKDSLKPPRN